MIPRVNPANPLSVNSINNSILAKDRPGALNLSLPLLALNDLTA